MANFQFSPPCIIRGVSCPSGRRSPCRPKLIPSPQIQKTQKPKSMNSRNRLNSVPSPTSHNPVADPFPAGVRPATLLRLAFLVNSMVDCSSEGDLSFPDVRDAAREGRLLELLTQRSGRAYDFSFLQSADGPFDELNSALRDSATILRGAEFVKAGVCRNGYCLALALVLYAVRERFVPMWPDQIGRA